MDFISIIKKEAEPYMDRIAIRREAMIKQDEDLYEYSFSTSFDSAKHKDHDRLVSAVKKINIQLIKDGKKPICSDDRYEAAKFCCIISGRKELVDYVD